jgi:hypothetical protein
MNPYSPLFRNMLAQENGAHLLTTLFILLVLYMYSYSGIFTGRYIGVTLLSKSDIL